MWPQRVTATVDLSALRHNLQRVREYAPASRVMGALKADAYGHGMVAVARALDDGLDAYAVACLEEAEAIRAAGCRTPCVLLEGPLHPQEIETIAARGEPVVLHADWQLQALRTLRCATPLPVWIKLDTGMNRLGFRPDQARRLAQAVSANPALKLLGWMTHLANADAADSAGTQAQLTRFFAATDGLPGARTIANSAGLMAYPQARVDWVRPGIMLYGASPLEGHTASQDGLLPTMRVESRLIAMRDVPAGEAVGYGSEWVCAEPTRVGVIAMGYGDGYPRHARSGTPVQVRGQTVALIGRVSMDMITVDLRSCPQAQVGDTAVLWGGGLPVESVAEHAGTIAYDLFCGLTNRVYYHYESET